MSAILQPMTLDEFLVWEAGQELRYEFDGAAPVAMTGGTIAHDQIIFDLRSALAARLAGKACRALGPNVKIIADARARYPDVFVVCGHVAGTATVAADPVIVFEVLSEVTSETDLIDKNRDYRATKSIQRYVVLQQTRNMAIVFARQGSGWLSEIISGENASLDLPEIEIALPMREIYTNVELIGPRMG